MPSAITHAVVGLALGKTYTGRPMGWRFWTLAVLCSAIPDADVIGFEFGVEYLDACGHRGFFHSLAFAAILGLVVVAWEYRKLRFSGRWWSLWAFFFVVVASHGLLDMLTNGGYGIALFSPFNNERHFFPWTPIEVSPIGWSNNVRWWLRVAGTEVVWVWLPALALAGVAMAVRRLGARRGR